MDGGAWWAAVHGVTKSWTRLTDFTFTFHFHALEKEMATHSSVLAWRIPGMGEPGGLPSMGSHRVGHDSSDLAAVEEPEIKLPTSAGSWKKQENSRKHLLLLHWLCWSLWLCGSQQTVENSESDGNIRPPYLPPEKFVCKSRSNS